jgi:nicotinate-nucleotide--dimethylbenzimidazole phosphoribosyltransferase
MVYQFLSGGAAVNVLCRQHSVRLQVVDVGVDHDFRQATGLAHRKIRRGSRNLRHEPAMTPEEMTLALKVGRDSVDDCSEAEALALGEMGIANTTASAALLAWLIGATAESVVGRGTGIAEPTLERKRQVVDEALLRHRCQSVDSALQCLGGLEIAALVGAIERAAECRKLIVLDGFITAVAALIAVRRTPSVASCLLASHVGAELGHTRALAELGLTPLFDLGLRLGEGTGAVMGLSCVQSAVRLMREMRTFEEANIERPLDPRNAAQPGHAHRGSRSI